MFRTKLAPMAVGLAVLTALVLSSGESAGDYRVVEGDTLSEIAERFGVSVNELAATNGIVDPDLILTGQVLLVPGSDVSMAPPPAEDGGGAYVVRSGDTLSELALEFGVPVSILAQANGIADPDYIVEGDVLTIPIVESPLARPYAPQIESILEEFAAVEGLDAGLVKAVAYVESGWRQNAVSPSGAVGVMQLQPSTAAWLESDVFGFNLNIETSAYDNIRAGVRYLSLLRDTTGDTNKAVAAYFQGPSSVSQGVLYEGTIAYVASVTEIRDMFWS
jgi:LysM repeat protein